MDPPVMNQPVIMECRGMPQPTVFRGSFPQLLIGGATWVARDPENHGPDSWDASF